MMTVYWLEMPADLPNQLTNTTMHIGIFLYIPCRVWNCSEYIFMMSL